MGVFSFLLISVLGHILNQKRPISQFELQCLEIILAQLKIFFFGLFRGEVVSAGVEEPEMMVRVESDQIEPSGSFCKICS